MKFDLEVIRSPAVPTEPGAYVVWLAGAKFPAVLCWSGVLGHWMKGPTRVQVDAFAGPLPSRGEA